MKDLLGICLYFLTRFWSFAPIQRAVTFTKAFILIKEFARFHLKETIYLKFRAIQGPTRYGYIFDISSYSEDSSFYTNPYFVCNNSDYLDEA